MKLPLKYYLPICLWLGAVAIPVGWRSYEKWKAEEVERLRNELAVLRSHYDNPWDDNGSGVPDDRQKAARLKRESELFNRIEDRLEELTGVRPASLKIGPRELLSDMQQLNDWDNLSNSKSWQE